MIETKAVVTCDRCKKLSGYSSPVGEMTAGYYTAPYWSMCMNRGEEHICDACMWADPRYIARYGRIPTQVAAAKEFRYGDNKTIHGTQHVNVEVDRNGSVVSVWFRCMPLPFDQTVVEASRARDMRAMYEKHDEGPKQHIKAIVFSDGSNG